MREEALTSASTVHESGVAALVWWRIRESALAEHPAAAGLKDAHRYLVLRDAVQREAIARAVSALWRAGVPVLTAKGWAIARHYPARGLRQPGDIDLFVAEGDFERARDARTPVGVPVDLHRGCPYLPDRPFADLIARAERWVLEGVEVLVPAAEDHLRLLCLHALKHGLARPVWLSDLAVAIETRTASFEWSRFLAGDRRRTSWAVAALELAACVLDARLPEPRPWGAATLPRWAGPAVLRAWDRPFRPRVPMASVRGGRAIVGALRERWPNPLEATVGVGAAIDGLPRLPLQVVECVRRTGSFAGRVLARETDRG